MHKKGELLPAGRPARRGPTRRVILDWPVDLHDKLQALADRERRPLTKQVQVLVERALAMEEEELVA